MAWRDHLRADFCCCCFDLQVGSGLIGLAGVVAHTVSVVCGFNTGHEGVGVANFVLLFACVSLFIGSLVAHQNLVFAWLIVHGCALVCIAVFFLVVFFVGIAHAANDQQAGNLTQLSFHYSRFD